MTWLVLRRPSLDAVTLTAKASRKARETLHLEVGVLDALGLGTSRKRPIFIASCLHRTDGASAAALADIPPSNLVARARNTSLQNAMYDDESNRDKDED